MKKICTVLLMASLTCSAGYMGTLPDIEADFSYKRKEQTSTPPVETYTPSSADEFKKAPNKVEYINIIKKKEKISDYINDITTLTGILEKLKVYMEDGKDVQMFNACVSNYIDHAAKIAEKYKGRPEEYYASYRAAVSFAYSARRVAVLKSESALYSKFLPYSEEGFSYSPQNIKEADNQLLKQLYDTLYVLKNIE